MFSIAGKSISNQHHPFVIAELSTNHGGSLAQALEVIDGVAESGADAVKLQTYTPATMVSRTWSQQSPSVLGEGPWRGRDLYELYEQGAMPWEWHESLRDRAMSRGLVFFSTPFDPSAVDFLESLSVNVYKLASFEITHRHLIRKIASTGKPIIMSTGMASRTEISLAVDEWIQTSNCQFALMKCTSAYPAPATDLNLRTIQALRSIFSCEVGFSDHSIGDGAALASVALGATLIEKHVRLDDDSNSLDSSFAMPMTKFAKMCENVKEVWEALGSVTIGAVGSERHSLALRRSAFASRNIPQDHVLCEGDVIFLRPAVGIPASECDHLWGRRTSVAIPQGHPIHYRDLF